MDLSHKVLAVITGPTASGKTGLAVKLASFFKTEVISADSRQIFKDIPIGTASPSEEDRRRAYHHLVGTLELDAYYSAAMFETDALKIAENIWQTRDVVIICGGSMLYIDALCNGVDTMPDISEETRRYVMSLFEQYGLDGVLAQLKIVDPSYYDYVDKANTRRVIHGLEVCLEAGKPFSELRTGNKKQRDFRIVKFAISRPRNELFDRINRRVDEMMEAGLLKEARRVLERGSYNSLNTVGYKELKAYFEGIWDLETAVARIAKNTRVYAKKQLTWLSHDPSVIWLSPETAFEESRNVIQGEIVNEVGNCSLK